VESEDVCRRVLKRTPASAARWAESMKNPRITTQVASADDEVPPDLDGYETSTRIDGDGMDVVWLVHERQFKRPLALKVMRAECVADKHRIRRFLEEARITAQLAHPSIVPVYAMGRLADGRPYYTMKLVEGKTLAELLKAGSDVASPRMDLLPVFARVCQALAFMHSNGVIHRDLKPSNVMVGKHGEVQVMDLGVAKVLAESDFLPAEARSRESHAR
jgi:serine/threonine-protein kinase